MLEEAGVYGDVNILEYRMDMIAFDDDVISLEMDAAYRESHLVQRSGVCFLSSARWATIGRFNVIVGRCFCSQDGDRSSLFYVARALINMQAAFGIFPVIRGVRSSLVPFRRPPSDSVVVVVVVVCVRAFVQV